MTKWLLHVETEDCSVIYFACLKRKHLLRAHISRCIHASTSRCQSCIGKSSMKQDFKRNTISKQQSRIPKHGRFSIGIPVNRLYELSRQISCSPVVLMSMACRPSVLEGSITREAWFGPFTKKLTSRSPPSITWKRNKIDDTFVRYMPIQRRQNMTS